MKKGGFLLLLLAALCAFAPLRAQTTVLGDRIPDVRPENWFNNVRPASAPLTVIAFFSASNPACLQALDHLQSLLDDAGTRMRVILVSRDREEIVDRAVELYFSPRMTVALDTDGSLFRSFGIEYVPFCILIDARRYVLWQGNTLHLTAEQLAVTTE